MWEQASPSPTLDVSTDQPSHVSHQCTRKRVLGFLERLEHSCFTLAGAVGAGSSVGAGDVAGEGSRAGGMSGGGRRRSGVPVAIRLYKDCISTWRLFYHRRSSGRRSRCYRTLAVAPPPQAWALLGALLPFLSCLPPVQ